MERRHAIAQPKTDSRSASFCDFAAQSSYQPFDSRPPDIGPSRSFKDGLERLSLGSVHMPMISFRDIVCKLLTNTRLLLSLKPAWIPLVGPQEEAQLQRQGSRAPLPFRGAAETQTVMMQDNPA
jgi:hypothetical protein